MRSDTRAGSDAIEANVRASGVRAGIAVAAAALLAACSNSKPDEGRPTAWRAASVERPELGRSAVHVDPTRPGSIASLNAAPGSVPKVRGVYKVGKPYVVNGQTYYPAEDPGYDRTGIASWYGTDFHGKQTANGELFDMGAITAAHPTLPMPSLVYVTNLRNGRTLTGARERPRPLQARADHRPVATYGTPDRLRGAGHDRDPRSLCRSCTARSQRY